MTDVMLSGVTVHLGGAEVLCDVSLHVRSGEWVGLVGPNGAGKTTLLRAIAGLVAYEGRLELGGTNAQGLSTRQRARVVALVCQRPAFPPTMSVADYVLLGRTPHIGTFDVETRTDRDIAMRSLDRLGVATFAARPLVSLSGGEQQRVVLARSLAQRATVLLLDEGTSALDLGAQQEVLEIVDALRASEGLTVISAMHDLSMAGQYADRLALISAGRLVACGKPDEVLTAELIRTHYNAIVRISRDVDGIVIRPTRHARARAQGVNR